ncbi:MAG: type II toxin-antitoxin system VapC family toxin [Candidatus Aegiribacteria sp.]|nr:type II toxin-antitoxin system VapC family toxin [Candidatus Aegiribacteria sp.]
MSKPIFIDTDVMIDFLRGYAKAVTMVKGSSGGIVLSSIVVAELYAGVKGKLELATLDDFIAFCHVAPVSGKIARLGGIYKRDYAKSHGVGIADAIIAATAQLEELDLKTLNIKHYPMLKGLKPPYTKE